MKKRIYVFTNIAPLYRSSLWKMLLKEENHEFHFFYGENKKSDIKTIDFSNQDFKLHCNRLHTIKNYWYKNKVLWRQKGEINRCLKDNFDIAIFLGEMYCISTWISAIICHLRKKNVIFWGHGLYGNESNLKLKFRKLFYKLADKHLLYERRAKQLMIKQGFNPDNLYVVFNSLDYDTQKTLRTKLSQLSKKDIFGFFKNPDLPVILFIGRLTQGKKIEILIQAVNAINKNNVKINLLIIGDGSERNNLETIGITGLKNGWLHFTGALYDEEEIGKYLYHSDLCVSPGNVGLTAIHSLSYGTPICSHNNLNNQMPEVEAITEGFNGFLFRENDVSDLTSKIEIWFQNNHDREKIREQCYQIIDKYYNPHYQVKVFNRLINNEIPEI
jgi:glycosyltransferase involved in cell wall biosynthesis